ncbi:MAG: hypothetical protein FJY56_02780 [Betaproteobacteria bacterium]|nr:hypothetical protein [Betaproteobacteria bacterium]
MRCADALATGGATTENFVYDALNRLLSRSGSGPGIVVRLKGVRLDLFDATIASCPAAPAST